MDDYDLRFAWTVDDGTERSWTQIPLLLDVRFLTDQAGLAGSEQFTGTFVGLCAHDLSGRRAHADFGYFSMQPS